MVMIEFHLSNGHDGISSELLKLVNDDISSCITLIINQSLTTGIFPDKLKIAKVTPVYKKCDKKLIFFFLYIGRFYCRKSSKSRT